MAEKMSFGGQEIVVKFLSALAGKDTRLVTTHISIVVLGATHAYKLKRAVRFPYLDFSTAEKRLAMCQREVELNRRFSSHLYLGAHRVTRQADGSLALDGAGELIDAVVVMRRFPDEALFDAMARRGALTSGMMETLASRVAKSHDDAAPDFVRGGAAAMRLVLKETAESLRISAPICADEVDDHLSRLGVALDANAALLDERRAQGKVRRCHGDLTLRNICLFEGEPTLFDCLEFDDALSTIDILYDLAFLLMDLSRVGAADYANLVLNRYLDQRNETDGLPLLPLFQSLRATIRAHVEAAQDKADLARSYFGLARSLLSLASGGVIAIGGLSGSGKSSVAAALAPRIGVAPGARTINSDRIRKGLFGAAPTTRLPPEAYASDVSAKVYRQMFDDAARVAATGWPVIVDAVLDRPEDRKEIEAIADGLGVPFLGVWLEADFERRAARVDARQNDVSDATREVLAAQMTKATEAISWRRVDAGRPLAAIVAEIENALPTLLRRA